MAKKIIKARLKQRTDTQANWAANNPVLLEGELGLVTDDKNLYKVGDGVTAWNDLPFRGFDGTLVHETGDSDSAAMSQRGVTRALAKLEENMANNEKIKELSGKIEQLAEENTRLKERIEEQDVFIEDLEYHKLTANSDNRYPDISVGTADNLAGVDVVDSEINFRRSGGGAITDGVARIEAIKGNSVVWNQQYPTGWSKTSEGITSTSVNGKISAVGTTTTSYFRLELFSSNIANHKYLFTLSGASSALEGKAFSLLNRGGDNLSLVTNGFACLFYLNNATEAQRNIGIKKLQEGITLNENLVVNQHDLTQMFGAGNEPTTIEEFYQRIPMGVDLNAYNEGEVIHMDVQSIESVGVNQWDEEWEQGSLSSSSGNNAASTAAIRSKNYLPVVGGKEYYINAPYNSFVFCYDKDKNFLGLARNKGGAAVIYNEAFSPLNDTAFIRFYSSTATYNHDICVNLSDTSINGQYYPHIKRQEDLSIIHKYFPDGMKSAGTAHDEIRYNKANGKWEKVVRIAEVDMGTLKWGLYLGNFYSSFGAASDIKINSILLCSPYNGLSPKDLAYSGEDKAIWSQTNAADKTIFARDTSYTDAASFKAAMQGVILYYELAEPIVTELDKEDQLKDWDYSVWNDGTERANAEGKSSAFAADLTYGFNAVGKIKELEGLVAQLRAKVGI